MPINDQLSGPIDLNQLLFGKKLEPLAQHHVDKIAEVVAIDVTGFSEQEVRSYVIDPIVEILGYQKGTIFEASLEHSVTFLGKHIFPDYQLALWKENFWLIEAKKPNQKKDSFDPADLRQAVEYSVHPTINASLVVLCDGVKLEVFDREASVDAPLLHVDIKNLPTEIDKIRALLEPMQVWFFQKRRVARLIDKVFDREYNLSRIEEFGKFVEGRLHSKNNIVLENFRKTPKHDENADLREVAVAPAIDLVEMYFPAETRTPVANAVSRRLVQLSQPNSFQVMYRIFPDGPRDVNDAYMGQALAYLMQLGEVTKEAGWMPSWLTKESADRNDIESATKYFAKQCLTYFEDHEAYRTILLASNALWRVAKIFAIATDAVRTRGAVMHAIGRYQLPEFSWAQFLNSPQGQLIAYMDATASEAIQTFVKRNMADKHTFKLESARHELRALWRAERGILGTFQNYAALSKERSLGEMRSAEGRSVTHDFLGHYSLCVMKQNPKWRDYVLAEHKPLVEKQVGLGSWCARELLGIHLMEELDPPPDEEVADRFFFGDVETLQSLRAYYKGDPQPAPKPVPKPNDNAGGHHAAGAKPEDNSPEEPKPGSPKQEP